MKKILLNFLLLFTFSQFSFSQVPQKIWDKTIGGSADEWNPSVIATPDGGFVIAGNSASGISGDKAEAGKGYIDYWIVKIDAQGQKVWDKTLGGSADDTDPTIISTTDGGFIIAGFSNSGISGDKTEASRGGYDYWIVKIDAQGQKIWDKTLGGNAFDKNPTITLTTDGGFIIAGFSNSGISGDKTEASRGGYDYWIVKIDAQGQKIWDKTLGGNANDNNPNITSTADGNYIIAGFSYSGIFGDKTEASKGFSDYWIVKINAQGQKIWDKTLGGDEDEFHPTIITMGDGGYIVAGHSSYSGISGDKTEASKGGYDYWIVKINAQGQKVWDKVLGGSNYDMSPQIINTLDGNYIIAGESSSGVSGDKTEANKGNADYWIVKINAQGQKIWDKTLGGSSWDEGKVRLTLTNDGFVVVGSSNSVISGDKSEASKGYFDYWIVKLGDNLNTCPNCITGITETSFSTQEHYCAAQNLCSQSIIIKAQPDPKQRIVRGDLAKISYLGLIGRTATTNAQYFPVPFVDLQNIYATDTSYYKYAKVLSYLEYDDGRSPFDRNLINFNPSDTITRASVLKIFLETWNIDENTATGTSPFSDVATTHPFYKYIKKAHELGIIVGSGGLFRPDVGCSREDAFLMLYRLMTNSTISKPTLTQINAAFFTPAQLRPDNLSVGVGTDRGNFNHYTKTSFAIDGVVPLVFAHSYNSYATELPDQLYPNYMGRGWTHSFNCYITTIGSGENLRMVVHYPDGKLHFYKQSGSTLIPESIGVFDQVTATTATSVTITTPSKIVYYFEKVTGQTDNYWLVKSIKDRNNNTLTFTNELGINSAVRLKSVADPAGRTMNFIYLTGQTKNYLSEVNLSGVGAFTSRKIEFTYSTAAWDGDGIKDLTSYKENDKNGVLKTTTYAYFTTEGSEHLLKTITLPKGNVIDNIYAQRKLKSSRTLNGSTVVQQMNTNWTPTYDATNQTSTSAVTVTAGAVTKTTNYTHNSNGLASRLQTTGTNPMDLQMDYGVTADPTSVTKITQNPGTAASTGVRIEYYPTAPYNVKLVKTAKAVGDSITQNYAYNSFNDITSFTNGRGFTTTFTYNATGNLTQITHPLGNPTVMVRNTQGLITQTTTPAGIVTNFTYNTYGNLTNTSTPNGSSPAITTSATYDALSRVASKTDARNQTVTYEYFANDLLKKMNAPLSYYVSYDYDANDNNTTVTNAKGNATTNVYHPQTDQLMSRSFGSKTESFTYNEDGSLQTYTNGRGNVFTFTYDASGRLTNDTYSAYAFNADGTLNTVTHTQGSKTYTLDYDYDLLKRLNKTTCDGFAVQYRYDNNNNLDLLTYPDGKTVSYTYDAKDRITSITDWAGRVTTYTYDNDGKVLSYTLPNGTKAIYTYDAAGRPTGIRHEKSTAAVICSYTFTLDQGGNHTEENIVEPYTNLPAITASTTNYTTDTRNQTTAAGSNNYTFDANGAISNQAGQAITWDSKDNLLTRNGISYFYDGNETRRAKTGKRYVINELSNSVLAETNDAGTYLYYYVYGPTGLLYRQNASTNAVEYYHYDFRGSTIALTNASQTVTRQYQYDAYGKILQQTPATATDDNPFRYVGQYGVQYEAPDLYFMRARYYDPTTGKFLSEDPIWSTNLFAYGDNNPINKGDFNGRKATFFSELREYVTDLGNIKDWVIEGVDYVSENYNEQMDALGEKLYELGGDNLVIVVDNLAKAKWAGTEYLDKAMKDYYDTYEKSVINGTPDNLALTGYLIASLWTPDSWIYTANAFTVGYGLGEGYKGAGLTKLIGKTGILGIIDMRTKAGLAAKSIYGAYNVWVWAESVNETYFK